DLAFNDRHRALMAWIARHDGTYKLGKDPHKISARSDAKRQALPPPPPAGRGAAPRRAHAPPTPARASRHWGLVDIRGVISASAVNLGARGA
ncbi:hypothetical protein PV435_46970, partial [Streptomyces scabiei]|nr:hypothetical protein [Streptomyces scabiei]